MHHLVRMFYFEMKRQLAHTIITEGIGNFLKRVFSFNKHKAIARDICKK